MKNHFLTYRFFVTILFTFFFQLVSAGPQGMSEEQMQQMMQQAEAMQQCMAKIDQSALPELEAKGRKMQAEIEALCQAGKRDEAMATGMKYGAEISSSPEIQAMRKCSEMAPQMMAQMQSMMPEIPDEEDDSSGHICDEM